MPAGADAHGDALAEIGRLAASERDADTLLRAVVETLARICGYASAGLWFVEAGTLALGPWAGEPPEAEGGVATRARACLDEADPAGERRQDESSLAVGVRFEGRPVAVLGVRSSAPGVLDERDERFLGEVAERIAGHCLVGWDTGGIPWDEVG